MSPECDSFHPGHHVHPIQFFRGHPPGRPVELITVTQSRQGGPLVVVVQPDGEPEEAWWFHDVPTVRAALARWQHSIAFLHRYALLIVGDPGVGSRPCLSPCRTPESWTACATVASLGSDDPAVLTQGLGGLLLGPSTPPWAGNLTEGRIIFISSNPSINEDEDYPRGDWPDEEIADFVTNRFTHGWVSNNRVLLRDGTYYPRQVSYWLHIRRRAAELLGREADPAVDYAMTEVVHCKSRGEIGVGRASALCVSLHLDRIIAASPAPLVVVVGARARDRLIPLWDLPAEFGTRTPIGSHERANLMTRELGGHRRVIAYLPHPNFREPNRHFAGFYPTGFPGLQRLAQGQLTPDDFMDQSS